MSIIKKCLRCNVVFSGDVCEICCDPEGKTVEEIEKYRGYEILKYSYEEGFRVDLGTKRSKLVSDIEEARQLIEYYLSPNKWGDDEKVMTVKDLIDYLQSLPIGAELFAYGGLGGFFSLNTHEEIGAYFSYDEQMNSLYMDHGRYESEDAERIKLGLEWIDMNKK